jgi:peptidoglycan/xylan/chitin deacetylase (PgdA/CDA1 family)
MIRLQSLLLIVVIVAVVIWGVRSVASGDAEPTPEPTESSAIAAQVTLTPYPTDTPTATEPPATRTPEPTSEPTDTPEPTAEPTDEPTVEPTEVVVERPEPPDVGEPGEAVLIERGESGRLEIALTFDAGEGAGHTAEILDLLAEYGIKCTFGVTGQWAEQNPDLMRRIVDEGHQLINHTYDHRSFTGFSLDTEPLTGGERQEQVTKTEAIIQEITGYETAPYFRFPYGDYDAASLEELDEIGFHIVAGYTCDTMAWMGYTANEIADNCDIDAVDGGPGAVILMHVVQTEDFKALPLIIDEYAAAGYDFVTFEQIIQP